jgi:hypothetical protein
VKIPLLFIYFILLDIALEY